MSTYSFNNRGNNQQRPQGGGFYDAFIIFYLVLNGICVGGVVRNGTHMIEHGFDDGKLLATLLYLSCALHTGQRLYQVYKDKQNNNNQKQR